MLPDSDEELPFALKPATRVDLKAVGKKQTSKVAAKVTLSIPAG
jgi:hypothetical protein